MHFIYLFVCTLHTFCMPLCISLWRFFACHFSYLCTHFPYLYACTLHISLQATLYLIACHFTYLFASILHRSLYTHFTYLFPWTCIPLCMPFYLLGCGLTLDVRAEAVLPLFIPWAGCSLALGWKPPCYVPMCPRTIVPTSHCAHTSLCPLCLCTNVSTYSARCAHGPMCPRTRSNKPTHRCVVHVPMCPPTDYNKVRYG